MLGGGLDCFAAAAADDDAARTPGLSQSTWLAERRWRKLIHAVQRAGISNNGPPFAPIINAHLTHGLAVVIARRKPIRLLDAFAQRWLTLPSDAPPSADSAAGAAILTVIHQILAAAGTCPPADTREVDGDILGGHVPLGVEESRLKNSLVLEILKVDRGDLINLRPRHRDRVGSRSSCSHEGPIHPTAVLSEERSAGDIVKAVRIAHNRSEDNRLPLSYLCNIRGEGDEERCPLAGGCRLRGRRHGAGIDGHPASSSTHCSARGGCAAGAGRFSRSHRSGVISRRARHHHGNQQDHVAVSHGKSVPELRLNSTL